MSSPGREPRKLFACEIVSFTDVELDKYLEERRAQCGITVVDVEDPENLPESFIQRLRDRANQPLSELALSRAVDLDEVNSRLLEFSAESRPPSRLGPLFPSIADYLSESARTATPREEHDKMQAVHFHNKLVLDGGRPAYSIDTLDDVVRNPEAYREALQPWQSYPRAKSLNFHVFREQWEDWENFRRWQKYNRKERRPHYPTRNSALNLFIQDFRRKYSTHTKAVGALLTLYNFARPFRLHDDPEQQDRLSTWIEYLGYACSLHYYYASQVKRRQPEFDKA
ncbi:hypothetical protein GGR58DRAFT_386548 [Xylaria digitata]|nr:hypothetical protein GGR58DRAFT_386548 [Xylaria digitata]